MSQVVNELTQNVVYSLAQSKGELTPLEKLFALHHSASWDQLRQRDQADILMSAGCFAEAIRHYSELRHWRKLGDAHFAMGETADALGFYSKRPDRDRLIALAVAREDWVEVLAQLRLGSPEPFLTKDIIFSGSSRAKGPYLKLYAHAAAILGEVSPVEEMIRFFGVSAAEARALFQQACSGGYSRDVAKVAKPQITKIEHRALTDAVEEGRTRRSTDLASWLAQLRPSFSEASKGFENWIRFRDSQALESLVFWLTSSGSFEVFKTCLFALESEHPTYGKPQAWEVGFYSAHPWLIRAGMSNLLKALIEESKEPSACVLLCCAFQHSASPFDYKRAREIDLEYVDPLVAIRAQPVWAEAVTADWQRGFAFSQLWQAFWLEGRERRFGDLRQLKSFKAMASAHSVVLQDAWQRDFEQVRWKNEHSAYLTLKSLLPDQEVVQHARPVWLSPQHLDIYLPKLNLAIEYHGEQHFAPVSFFGGDAGYEATKLRDENKRRLCSLAGVHLEHIRFDEDLVHRLRQIAEISQSQT